MTATIRKHWHDFKTRPPGRRFQDIHRKARANKAVRKQGITKAAIIGGGVLLTLVGIFFLAVPGPGLLVIAIGLILIASESITMARFLDWLEVKVRALIDRLINFWRRSSTGQRVAVSCLGVLVAGAAAAAAAALFWNAIK